MNSRQRTPMREAMKVCLVLMIAGSLLAPDQWALAAQNEKPAGAERTVQEQAPKGEAALEAGKGAAAPRPDLEIIARVNGDPVTRAQFDQMVGNPITLRQAKRELGIEQPDRKDLERVAMKRLVQLRLLVQEARRRNLTLSEKELDQTISAISHRFEALKDFGTWIKDQGLNDPLLFDTVRTDILVERATKALAREAIVTEEEALKYFVAHQDDLIIGGEVRLRIIAVRSKAEADEVFAAVKKGVPFDRLARRLSAGKLAAKGGDTGWVNFQALPALLRDAAAALKPGEVGEPIEKSKDEFLIVGLQDRRPVLAKSLAEARPEIERRLLPAKQREAVQAWLEEQEKKSKIEVFLQHG